MRKKSVSKVPWKQVVAEIRKAIEEHHFSQADSVAWHMLSEHKLLKGKDKDFHTCCTFRAIYHEAREQLNKPPLDPGTQTKFAGFDVQQRYDIERGGRRQHVLTLEMTCQEMVDKAMERLANSRTLAAEGHELLRLARHKFGDEAVDECLGKTNSVTVQEPQT